MYNESKKKDEVQDVREALNVAINEGETFGLDVK
jgi:hypothetical protein